MKKVATIATKTSTTTTTASTGRKRKLRLTNSNNNIDDWMPNVDELLQQQQQQQQLLNAAVPPSTATATANKDNSTTTMSSSSSNIVRLHGLPTNVKPEHIRKLFHGLHPICIFVLPTFIQHIYGWDTLYHTDNDGGSGSGNTSSGGTARRRMVMVVKRQPYHFRVFVKFTSSLVANIAIVAMDDDTITDINDDINDNNKTEACIAITPVSKVDASFIQRYLVSMESLFVITHAHCV
jgi:hypothetical protein